MYIYMYTYIYHKAFKLEHGHGERAHDPGVIVSYYLRALNKRLKEAAADACSDRLDVIFWRLGGRSGMHGSSLHTMLAWVFAFFAC